MNKSRTGKKLGRSVKCYACGGFLPWENWGRFWQSNMDVGNGGVLQRPAPDYDELNKVIDDALRFEQRWFKAIGCFSSCRDLSSGRFLFSTNQITAEYSPRSNLMRAKDKYVSSGLKCKAVK